MGLGLVVRYLPLNRYFRGVLRGAKLCALSLRKFAAQDDRYLRGGLRKQAAYNDGFIGEGAAQGMVRVGGETVQWRAACVVGAMDNLSTDPTFGSLSWDLRLAMQMTPIVGAIRMDSASMTVLPSS